MGLDEPLLSAGEYRARSGAGDERHDNVIEAQIIHVQRYLEEACHDRFGQSDAGEVRTFRSLIPGRIKLVPSLVTLTTVFVDDDADGDYELEIPAASLKLLPLNAALDGRPYHYLELAPWQSVVGGFPHGSLYSRGAETQVTGIFGWPSPPGMIVELIALTTRQLRDLERGGITSSVQAIDQAIQMAPGASSLMKDVRKKYGRAAVGMVM